MNTKHTNDTNKRLDRAPLMVALAAVAASAACGTDTGDLTVTAYGEDFIEQGIPAATGPDDEGFVDNTEVQFTHFIVSLSDLNVATRDGAVGAQVSSVGVFDVHAPGPHVVSDFTLSSDTYADVGVTVAPIDQVIPGNISATDADTMRGLSVRAGGSAVHEGTTYTFDWSFTTGTRYGECQDGEGFDGIVVPEGGRVTAQITIHGDHLFFDDLQSETPSLRFAAMAAADADGDQDITLEELADVDLTTLPIDQYGTGGDGSVRNLRQFVEAQTQNLVHFQGEGHCLQVRL